MEWIHASDSMASLRFVRSHVHVSFDESGDTSRPFCVECVSTLPFLSLHLRQLRRILCYCFLKAATPVFVWFFKANVGNSNFALEAHQRERLAFSMFLFALLL